MINEAYLDSIYSTTKDMYKDRGYEWLPNTNLVHPTDKILLAFKKIDDPSKYGVLTYINTVGDIREPDLVSLIVNENITVTIINYCNLTVVLNNIQKFSKNVEFFEPKDLYYNVIKHYLQPQISIVSADEKFKKEIKPFLTYLQPKDPICRYFKLEAGNIVKFTQDGRISFRVVLNSKE